MGFLICRTPSFQFPIMTPQGKRERWFNYGIVAKKGGGNLLMMFEKKTLYGSKTTRSVVVSPYMMVNLCIELIGLLQFQSHYHFKKWEMIVTEKTRTSTNMKNYMENREWIINTIFNKIKR